MTTQNEQTDTELRPDHLYVVGGRQRRLRELTAGNTVWEGYDKGVIVRIDLETAHRHVCLEYSSPPEVCAPDEPEIMFQSATLCGSILYACTGTEVITYSLPDFRRIGYVSLPWFNDVHHARPGPGGTLLVASAGLELVVELTPEAEVKRMWNVLGEEPWTRFSPDVDYRRVGSTKPHRSHPNHLFCIGEDIWATRFQQGDAICLTRPGGYFKVSPERIHDGIVFGDHIYFTSVEGKIVVVSTETLRVEEVIDLTTMNPEGTVMGWCRGVLPEGNNLWVGYSRIRPTKARENVSWLMRGFKKVRGTQIACYDLASRTRVRDIYLEPVGLNAVFTIFRFP